MTGISASSRRLWRDSSPFQHLSSSRKMTALYQVEGPAMLVSWSGIPPNYEKYIFVFMSYPV